MGEEGDSCHLRRPELESKKGPVDILVIDHVEKVPTEN